MSMPMKEFKALHKAVDEIFAEAYRLDMSWYDLAAKANLAVATVYNLGNYETVYPRAATVFQLAQAVGFKIQMVKNKMKLKIAS